MLILGISPKKQLLENPPNIAVKIEVCLFFIQGLPGPAGTAGEAGKAGERVSKTSDSKFA